MSAAARRPEGVRIVKADGRENYLPPQKVVG